MEFHYYTTYFLALKAGFSDEEAEILAYSCQYVDNNLITYEITIPNPGGKGELFVTEPTQNFGFWSDRFAEEVYIPFHFFPGVSQEAALLRRDGREWEFVVTPNSPGAKEILVQALKSRDLFRIGIALHTFADTWAHQNFSGLREQGNVTDPSSALPPVGHAQVFRNPDVYDLVWNDSRLKVPMISNRERFREAAVKIYRYLCTFRGRDFQDEDQVIRRWEELFSSAREGSPTEERMADFIIEGHMTPYDRKAWLEEAVLPGTLPWQDETLFQGFDKVLWLADELLYKKNFLKKERLQAREYFQQSRFYRWQRAAGDQRTAAQVWLDKYRPGWRERI